VADTLVISGAAVVTLDDDSTVYHDGAVVVEGDGIVDVGPAGAVHGRRRETLRERRIDAAGAAVLPGLVDLHCHTAVERGGYTESLDLLTALTEHWYPMVRGLDAETAYRCALYTYARCLRSGTTTVNDMFRPIEGLAAAAEEIGIRATYAGLVATPETGLDSLEDNAAAFREVHGGGSGRIAVRIGIEWLPLASEELLVAARRLADELGCGIHLHLSESSGEVESSLERFGRRPVAVAHDCGILGRDCIAAHCVQLGDEDVAMLASTGTHVAHAPTANAKMGAGIAPVPELLAAGINVGLGHDSTEGNNTSDLFEVMRAAVLVQRAARENPAVLGALDALRMGARNGARALRIEAGVIAPGRAADLIVVDAGTDFFDPAVPAYQDNLLTRLVFATSGASVRTVIVAGRVVVENGRLTTVDEAEVAHRARDAVRRLKAASGRRPAKATP
jgi:5-methylthioadenosine/S-adenosylhomocysteine deaminase